MLIEAVVEKGQVRFLHPVKFLHDYFSVKIEIPDQEFAAEVPNGHGNVTTPDNETCHARSLTPVPPLPKGEGYSSSLREFHVKPGDCCVFCSYGSVPCPPIQAGNDDCYRP